MKFLLTVLLLPCVFGAHSICSDNRVCPEGTKCCTTYDDKIRCCDVNNPNSIYVKTSKPHQVVPSKPLQAFVNSTEHIARFGSCIEDITCDGTCCEDNCCPFKAATCCDSGCCSFYSTCCEGYTKFIETKRWCCVEGMKCGDADDQKCISKGSFLTPYLIVVLSTATLQMWLFVLFAY